MTDSTEEQTPLEKAQAAVDQIEALRMAINALLPAVPEEADLARKWMKSAEFDLGRAKYNIIMKHNEKLLQF